jgi:hypothetical protein
MKHKSKLFEIDAVQWIGNTPAWRSETKDILPKETFCSVSGMECAIWFHKDLGWQPRVRLNRFDWLIKDTNGHIYALPNEVFKARYEVIADEN